MSLPRSQSWKKRARDKEGLSGDKPLNTSVDMLAWGKNGHVAWDWKAALQSVPLPHIPSLAFASKTSQLTAGLTPPALLSRPPRLGPTHQCSRHSHRDCHRHTPPQAAGPHPHRCHAALRCNPQGRRGLAGQRNTQTVTMVACLGSHKVGQSVALGTDALGLGGIPHLCLGRGERDHLSQRESWLKRSFCLGMVYGGLPRR